MVIIKFSNNAEIKAEQNGTCFITKEKPNFPEDLTKVILDDGKSKITLIGVEVIECASNDSRYWFSFAGKQVFSDREEKVAQIEILKKKLADTDYKCLKYVDGALTEEEYTEVKAYRAELRKQINVLEKDV